jgi:hypothetical protein
MIDKFISKIIMNKIFLNREVSRNVFISSEWTEIIANPPLEILKRFQRIYLEIECEQTENQGENIWYLEDGTVINPQVQLVDEFGNYYDLEGGNASGHYRNEDVLVASKLGFSYRLGKLPTDRKYTKIRVRNDQPFVCSKITWLNYEMK